MACEVMLTVSDYYCEADRGHSRDGVRARDPKTHSTVNWVVGTEREVGEPDAAGGRRVEVNEALLFCDFCGNSVRRRTV